DPGRTECLLDILRHLASQQLCRKDRLRGHHAYYPVPSRVVYRLYLDRDLIWIAACPLHARRYVVFFEIDIQHLALSRIGSPPLQAAWIDQPLQCLDPFASPPCLAEGLSRASPSFYPVSR